jgi:hypothetical protein
MVHFLVVTYISKRAAYKPCLGVLKNVYVVLNEMLLFIA